MTGAPYDEDADTLVYDKSWQNPAGDGGFRMTVSDTNRGVIRATGRGTLDGARATVAHMNEALALIGDAHPFTGLVDMRDVSGSPLRAQFVLGKWLIARKRLFERIAIFGAKPWEAKLAYAVIRMARMKERVTVLATEAQALQFLGWR